MENCAGQNPTDNPVVSQQAGEKDIPHCSVAARRLNRLTVLQER
jgi:hypothetical protein